MSKQHLAIGIGFGEMNLPLCSLRSVFNPFTLTLILISESKDLIYRNQNLYGHRLDLPFQNGYQNNVFILQLLH
jgi:hypothetical protein